MSVRHYFLEFGKTFRYRELSVNAAGIAIWAIVILYLIYQTFVVNARKDATTSEKADNIDLVKFIMVFVAMVNVLMPVFITVFVASLIQKNFKSEIRILKKRDSVEALEMKFSHKNVLLLVGNKNVSSAERKQQFAMEICESFIETFAQNLGFNTVLETLDTDYDEYSLKMLGKRVDQGTATLLVPIVAYASFRH